MRIDREALLAEALDEVEHLPGLGDAERRGRLVEDHDAWSSTSRPWRPRPTGAGRRTARRRSGAPSGCVVTESAAERLAARASPSSISSRRVQRRRRSSRPRYMFWTTSRLSREREVLVDDLDPERGGVLRAVDRDRLALEEDLARVDRVDPGDALDERRLAGAVVADERHDLARRDVEVDLVERLDGAEALRDALAAPAVVLRCQLTALAPPAWSDGRRGAAAGGAPSRRIRSMPADLQAAAYLPGADLAALRGSRRRRRYS